MSNVIRFYDKPEALVETSRFPYATFPFPTFNQVQSGLFDIYQKDANFCIASSTSSGKTACGEMVLSHEIRHRGGTGVYIGPLRALAKEKIDRWTKPTHHFSDLKQSILTGDFTLTEARKKEIDSAQLVVMTSEMLASKTRNFKSEKNDWLQRIGTIAVDESHLLTVPDRGVHLEVALMKLTELNPDVRIMHLSATLPNVQEICHWTSKLNGKPTYLVESTYRPCKLNIHYPTYFDVPNSYDDNEAEKVDAALHTVRSHPKDKFIIFAHTKKTGEMMKESLKSQGIESKFHKADLEKEERFSFMDSFMEKEGLRVLVATSGLAWGVDSPARRVIILGIHRGMSIVPNYDIHQECGRAGRPGYDDEGDAYVFLPRKNADKYREMLEKPTFIESQLLERMGEKGNYKTLAFHIVSEIHHGNIKNKKDLYRWYERSLAFIQSKDMDDVIASNVLDCLKRCGAVREEDGKLVTTTTGAIASMFYYNPFDVSDLKKNFALLFKAQKESNDFFLSMCLANTDSNRFGIVSKSEREEIGWYAGRVKGMMGGDLEDAAIKIGFCYYNLLNGHHNESIQSIMRNLKFDFGRTVQVLSMLDQMGAKWNRKEFFTKLKMRIQKGVPENLVYLASLDNIGVARAQRLYDAGFRTADDMVKDPVAARKVLKMSKMSDKIIDDVLLDAGAVKYRELF